MPVKQLYAINTTGYSNVAHRLILIVLNRFDLRASLLVVQSRPLPE